MATLAQIKTTVDNRLAAIWPTVQAKEASYLAGHGIYWQGIVWSSTDPADGATVVPDTTRAPYYQSETWAVAFPSLVGVAEPMNAWIDTYEGPNGKGYVAFVQAVVLGNTYWRAQQVGNETWRTFGWVQRTALP